MFVLMAPRYLKEFTLAIVSPSSSMDKFALSSPTAISFVFGSFNLSSLILQSSILSFVLCCLFPVDIYHTVLCRLCTA